MAVQSKKCSVLAGDSMVHTSLPQLLLQLPHQPLGSLKHSHAPLCTMKGAVEIPSPLQANLKSPLSSSSAAFSGLRPT
jgi:hypothetical protein